MDPVTALSQAFDQMHRIVRGVTADQLGNPTPCTEWDVRTLLTHAYNVVNGITACASGAAPEPLALDESDLTGQFRTLADRALGVWRGDGALEREIDAGAGPMPGVNNAGINTLDTLVHSWDLAHATGQDSAIPDELAVHTLGVCRAVISPETRRFAGFAGPIDVPATASPTDQLVAFLGRRP
jgi:uncharacterized protein (TIGR03086 family)